MLCQLKGLAVASDCGSIRIYSQWDEGFEVGQMSVTMFEILRDKLSSLLFQAWAPYFVKHIKIMQEEIWKKE